MALKKLFFYKGTFDKTTYNYIDGAIYFDTGTKEIRLGQGGTGNYTVYGSSGNVSDANLNTDDGNVILTISKVDGTNITLDFSDIASAKDVSVTFDKLTTRIGNIETAYAAADKDLKKLIENIIAKNADDGTKKGFNLDYTADKRLNLTYTAGTETTTVSSIDAKEFIKDGMIKGTALAVADGDGNVSVAIGETNVGISGCTAGHTYIVLLWNIDAGNDATADTDTTAIDVTTLIDVYIAGDGISVNGNKISVKHDDTLKTDDDGTLGVNFDDDTLKTDDDGTLGVNFGSSIQKTDDVYDTVWQLYTTE